MTVTAAMLERAVEERRAALDERDRAVAALATLRTAARRAEEAMSDVHHACEAAACCFDIAHSEARHALRAALEPAP